MRIYYSNIWPSRYESITRDDFKKNRKQSLYQQVMTYMRCGGRGSGVWCDVKYFLGFIAKELHLPVIHIYYILNFKVF